MKKFLAIILAMAMCISLFPTAYAEGTGETETEVIKYTFASSAYGKDERIARAALEALTLSEIVSGAPWRVDGHRYIESEGVETDSVTWQVHKDRINSKSAVFVIELTVPSGGTYIPSLEYTTHSTGFIADVYLVPKTEETPEFSVSDDKNGDWDTWNYLKNTLSETGRASYKLGNVDFYSPSKDSAKTPFSERTFEANSTYYLFFDAVGVNEKFTDADLLYNAYINSFTLTPKTDNTPTDYEYNFTVSALSALSNSPTSLGYSALRTKKMTDVLSAVSDPWEWAGFAYTDNLSCNAAGVQMNIVHARTKGKSSYVALELDVENGGKYVPSLVYKTDGGSLKADVYLIKNDGTVLDGIVLEGYQDTKSNILIRDYVTKWQNDGVSGYQLADDAEFYATEEATVTFNECTLDSDSTYYLIFNFVGPDEGFEDSYTFYYYAKSFALDAVESEASEIEKAFDYAESDHTGTGNASITAYAVYGTDGVVVNTQTIATPAVTYGNSCEISAPATYTDTATDKTYSFLYWAKGMTMGKKQVVSYSATIPEYRPHEGVNYLIAVYEEDGASADTIEFYNANGQLLDLALTDENKLPDLPSMAGYGKATAWALRNADGTYTEYEEDSDVSGILGNTLIFMAKYNDLEKNIPVTVNGGEPTYYAYGDPVPCTSNAENFSYWTKTVNGKTEIVSTKKEYTFNAYEECTVTEVCEGEVDLGKTMRKIILSTFTAGEETAVMAEFIGFDDALEKGIMFGTQKIAMNTDKTQFTVINDANGTTNVTGYAIINDGALKKITAGELTVSAE